MQNGRLKLDHSKVLRRLLERLIPAENASTKESGRDWSEYMRNLTDAAVERGYVPATQADLRQLRSNLVEFGAAQTRRLAVRQNLPSHAYRGAPPRGSVAALVAPGPAVRFGDDFTSGMSPMASVYWPRGGKPAICRIQGAGAEYHCGRCAHKTYPMMSWCPECGSHRPDSCACYVCRMTGMGIGEYCRFRISSGCPRVKRMGAR